MFDSISASRYIENGDRPARRENPHKYLLYKPTLSQVLVFLASGFKELPANGALLLYVSADGCFSTTKHPEDSKKCFWNVTFYERNCLSYFHLSLNEKFYFSSGL